MPAPRQWARSGDDARGGSGASASQRQTAGGGRVAPGGSRGGEREKEQLLSKWHTRRGPRAREPRVGRVGLFGDAGGCEAPRGSARYSSLKPALRPGRRGACRAKQTWLALSPGPAPQAIVSASPGGSHSSAARLRAAAALRGRQGGQRARAPPCPTTP